LWPHLPQLSTNSDGALDAALLKDLGSRKIPRDSLTDDEKKKEKTLLWKTRKAKNLFSLNALSLLSHCSLTALSLLSHCSLTAL
jgi:hypothetical protein